MGWYLTWKLRSEKHIRVSYIERQGKRAADLENSMHEKVRQTKMWSDWGLKDVHIDRIEEEERKQEMRLWIYWNQALLVL